MEISILSIFIEIYRLGVMRSIQNPITKELLIDFVRKRALKPNRPPQEATKRPQNGTNGQNNLKPNPDHIQNMPPPIDVPPAKKQKCGE